MRLWLTAGVAALLVGCSSGAITGNVIMGQTPSDLAVYASVWEVDSQLSNPKDPNSPLVPNNDGNAPTPVGTIAIGTSSGGAETFKYTFAGLDKGLYFVGAFLDDPSDTSPNIPALIHTIDSASLLEVNPSSKTEQEVEHDIYLAISAPGTGTVKGTVHMSAAAQKLPMTVFASTGSIIDSSATIVDQQEVASGSEEAYAFFNLPLGSVYLFGDGQVGEETNLAADTIGFPLPSNPISPTASSPEVDGVDIWVGAQAPGFGAIGGELELNAPIAAQVSIFALSDTGEVLGLVNSSISGAGGPLSIPSLPFGDVNLQAIDSVVIGGLTLSPSLPAYYPGAPAVPSAITLTPAVPAATVVLPLGVGQVIGNVQLTNLPSGITDVWVVATVTLPAMGGLASELVVQQQEFPVSGANPPSFSYDLFGLTDGAYLIQLIPAASESDDPVSLLNAKGPVCAAQPPSVTIAGGDRVNADFQVSAACPPLSSAE